MLGPLISACLLFPSLLIFTIMMMAVECFLLAKLNGIALSHRHYLTITLGRMLKNWGGGALVPDERPRLMLRCAVLGRFFLSFAPWAFIPMIHHEPLIQTKIDILYILLIFQLQFTADLIAVWSSGSKFALLSVNRRVVLHLTSQFLLTIVLLSMTMSFGALDFSILYTKADSITSALPFVFITLIALLCKNGIGPFGFTTKQYELLGAEATEFSSRLLVLGQLSYRLDVLFSGAFLVILFFDAPFCSSVGCFRACDLQFFFFVFKTIGFFLLFLWIHGTILLYRANQWLYFFQTIFLPLSGFLLLMLMGIRFLSN